MPWVRLLGRYLLQMAQGIQYCHQKGIVHCDVKLENVLVDNGVAKIGDFGVAKECSSSFVANTFLGTPYYLSPEICEDRFVDRL